jgi:predicted transcriptional regulator
LEDEVMARLDKIAVSQKKSRSGLAQHFLEKGIRQLEGGCK